VDLYLHQQAIDTSSPAGRALFQMLGVFAEFERSLIRERVMSGLDRAKAQGKQLGRPKLDSGLEADIRRALVAREIGIRKIATQFGVGTGTVQRIDKELRNAAAVG
jgi:DNA invertase Pin-like site-specific DNA recombinase